MKAFRIASTRFPLWNAFGAMMYGGRWNSVGRGVIYGSQSYAGAMLEVLVHANSPIPPKGYKYIEIDIPDGITIEICDPAKVPGWDADDMVVSLAFGDRWFDEKRSAVLLVPSVVTHGPEMNVVIHPHHPECSDIAHSEPRPVLWDPRLTR
jgi:RES domain-containing protein